MSDRVWCMIGSGLYYGKMDAGFACVSREFEQAISMTTLGDEVVVLEGGTVRAISKSGGESWVVARDFWPGGMIASAGRRLFVLENNQTLYELVSGGERHARISNLEGTSLLIGSNEGRLFAIEDGTLMELLPDEGRAKALLHVRDVVAGAVTGGKVYLVAPDSGLYRIDPSSPELELVSGDWRSASHMCALSDGTLCILDGVALMVAEPDGGRRSISRPWENVSLMADH